MPKKTIACTIVALVVTGAGPATAKTYPLPQGNEVVPLDPSDFSTRIDNPFLPMPVGRRTISRETTPEGDRLRTVVTITKRTKLLASGVTARVVHDVTRDQGRLVERTDDYYAQDRAGNVWYLGEATTAYEPGKAPSTAGSFEAGVGGAQGGVAMPGHPHKGQHYRQESDPGNAEDRAAIISTHEQASVPFGHFSNVVMTREHSPVEPRNVEFKFYARGTGEVLAISVSGDDDRAELIEVG
ncbi:MAG: hypothetical protein QOF76_5442 [Solirubrobacteraceae bacterium]|nr:hypothetical protein [Solirubrobacteraceae bacterium]